MNDSLSIQCRDATVQFAGGVRAVDSVNLDVRDGERLAIVGQSGCGKTTLLRAVAGLQSLSAGQINVSDCSMSFVFQQPALLPWRRVLDNVRLPLELQRQGDGQRLLTSQRDSMVKQALEEVELGKAHSLFPFELSGGMQMRVSIARALVTQPSLLLLDEPFAALDDLLRTQLGDLVRNLWRSHGFTMLLVTHNIGEAIQMSDRICVMNRGTVAAVLDNPMRWDRDQTHHEHQTRSGWEMRRSSEFGEFYGQVSDCLREAAGVTDLPCAGGKRSG